VLLLDADLIAAGLSPLAPEFLAYVQAPDIAHTVAFAGAPTMRGERASRPRAGSPAP
jgi:hypothetical protein